MEKTLIMSKKILFGTLNTIELLLFLSPEKFKTSKIIRNQFPNIGYDTMYKKLKTLLKQDFIEVLEKKGDFAGDDRTEYKLTQLGIQEKNDLINKMLILLKPYINQIVEKKTEAIEEPIKMDKEEQIQNFLMEFSGECEDIVESETLNQLQKILIRLLEKTT